MPLRTSWAQDNCPIARAADVFGDPWSVLVLREVFMGNRRFDSIKKALAVADNILSERLRRLVDAGVLVALPYSAGARPRKEYHLTASGRDALPVLHAMLGWAQKHTESPSGRVLRVICGGCGAETRPGPTCASCGNELTVGTTLWEHPRTPGRRIGLADPEFLDSSPH